MDNLHPVMQAALAGFAPPPRYAQTTCSQCGQPQGPGASGFSACSEHRMAEYRKALAAMDWQFDHADDHGKWAKGVNDLARLHRMQRELDPLGEIWMQTPGANGDRVPRPFVRVVPA